MLRYGPAVPTIVTVAVFGWHGAPSCVVVALTEVLARTRVNVGLHACLLHISPREVFTATIMFPLWCRLTVYDGRVACVRQQVVDDSLEAAVFANRHSDIICLALVDHH